MFAWIGQGCGWLISHRLMLSYARWFFYTYQGRTFTGIPSLSLCNRLTAVTVCQRLTSSNLSRNKALDRHSLFCHMVNWRTFTPPPPLQNYNPSLQSKKSSNFLRSPESFRRDSKGGVYGTVLLVLFPSVRGWVYVYVKLVGAAFPLDLAWCQSWLLFMICGIGWFCPTDDHRHGSPGKGYMSWCLGLARGYDKKGGPVENASSSSGIQTLGVWAVLESLCSFSYRTGPASPIHAADPFLLSHR